MAKNAPTGDGHRKGAVRDPFVSQDAQPALRQARHGIGTLHGREVR
jgi:hypothetical protein